MLIDKQRKEKSIALMLTVVGVELAIFMMFFILDIYYDIPILSEGMFVHYSLLFFYMIFLWSGLGIDNMFGTVFLTIYFIIVSLYFEINTHDGDSPSRVRYLKKVIKFWYKSLTK